MTSNTSDAFLARLLGATILATIATSPVFAQTATETAVEGDYETIVITGSRLARPELESSAPIAVLGADVLERDAAVNIQDTLQEMPQVGIGTSRTNSNFLTGSNGVATVNLRNLGSNRTLVLVNGRRFISGIAGSSAVDLNNIPTDFVERVEVVTGGASAIYGSEAIAGVVNFVLKEKFEGFSVRAQTNLTQKGDNPRHFVSLTGGTSFGADQRGSVIFNFSYDKDEGLLSRDRSISAEDCYFDICGPDAYSSYAAQGNFGLINSNGAFVNAFNGQPRFSFDEDNNLLTGYGAGFNRNAVRRISVPVERYLVSSILNYDLTDNIQAFAEITYSRVRSGSQIEALALSTPDIYATGGIPITNAYIPQAVLDQVNAWNLANPENQVTAIDFRRRQNEVFDRSNHNKRDTWRVATGLTGDITDRWRFETSFVYGHFKDFTSSEDIDNNRYRNALDSIVENGQIVCRSEAARAEGCVPINLFGYGTASPEASAYVQAVVPKSQMITQEQYVFSGAVTGSLITLPAGDVNVAIGAEYRSEKSIDDLDILTNTGGNSGNEIPDTIGDFDVWEVFGEVDVPLLREKPFFHYLGVGAALRYSEYSQGTVGGVVSWNVNGNWSPVRGLSLRGTYAVANRAPNISEFASAPSETFAAVTDPCNGVTATRNNAVDSACRAIPAIAAAIASNGTFQYTLADLQGINGFIGGNPDLAEETAKTLTLGAVFQPARVPGLSLTVDYFDIRVEDAISTVGRNLSIEQCLLTGLEEFCQNVTRSGNTGFVTQVDDQLINVSDISTRGIDLGFRFTSGIGLLQGDRLDISGNYTHLIHFRTQANAVAPVEDLAGEVGYSQDKFTIRTNYSTGPVSFNWQVTYLSKAVGDVDYIGDETVYGDKLTLDEMNRIKARFYHDIQLRFDVGQEKKFGLYFGVDNLFNTKPPFLPGTPFGASPTGTETAADVYDPFGRRFYAGVNMKF
ncbi:TonB-dependent receptor [Sandaracinobacter sp. RS1-74]|uniref:TonB-dependent receptor plug domain-containing protein n=1 Tax=Sandaracinobacteroides sayramensis TaxID=2913411 RepID=UPI001EDA22D3|nr:TonB-dependent receptor [Sandaracinobacteroides sayramensis]MCG2842645.1 TonB-dependent receptor [Sandaracinobacteroides sayramensis]